MRRRNRKDECYADLVYLFYFAIDEKQRGKGYGSRLLWKLQEQYKGKVIFLAREQLVESARNYEQRVKRREFYSKNGFVDLPYQLKEAREVYDVMSVGGTVSAKDYDTLITNWCGKFIRKMVDMRFIEKRS